MVWREQRAGSVFRMKMLVGECLEKETGVLKLSSLKLKTKCTVLWCRQQRERGESRKGQLSRACAVMLTMLLSRHLNCVNITGEISSYLMKEKEVPIFL